MPQADSCTAAKLQCYSITLSARAMSVGGKVRPSAFAVLKLMTNSNLVGCWIGRSPAFAPLNIRNDFSAWPVYGRNRSTHQFYFPRENDTNPSRFGIFTFGSVRASIVSLSAMMPLRFRI